MISQTEKTIALRYLKPRRNDGFLRIIKFFSCLGNHDIYNQNGHTAQFDYSEKSIEKVTMVATETDTTVETK